VVKSRDPYFKFWVCNHVFGIGKDRHFKLHVLIDTEEYSTDHPEGNVQSHVTSLTLTSGNKYETMQDREMSTDD